MLWKKEHRKLDTHLNTFSKRYFIIEKLSVTLLGIFLCLVLLEIGIRLGGSIFLSLQEYRNKLSIRQKGTYRIMCLGESTTMGDEDSYPFQLEKVLNQRNIGIKFNVINKGIGGVNSSYILEHLEDNINEYKPDIVTVMIGINDKGIKYYEIIPSANTMLFNKFRAYRFFKIIWMHIVNKEKMERSYGLTVEKLSARLPEDTYLELGKNYTCETKYPQAEESFKKAIEIDPRNRDTYLELGWVYNYMGKYPQAEESFKKAIEIDPKDSNAYFGLGKNYTCETKYPQAEESFKKAIEIDPKEKSPYIRLALLYQEMGQYESAEEYFKKVNNLRVKYCDLNLYRNYQKLKEILTKRGIKLVCMQYPARSVEPLKKMFINTEGIIFVNNEMVFKNALKKEKFTEYFRDMFGGDFGHCTSKGNRLLAENIANVLLGKCFDNRVKP
jgi:tetratricopeptide (TPR) repeat protein